MSNKRAEDPLADTRQLIAQEIPHGVDRRSFLMRTAVGGAAAVMTGCAVSPEEKSGPGAAPTTPLVLAGAAELTPDGELVTIPRVIETLLGVRPNAVASRMISGVR